MYADLGDQFTASEYFNGRLLSSEADSPEFEKWILEELGRHLVAGACKTDGRLRESDRANVASGVPYSSKS
jgi:hypothetical protein